MNIFDHSYKAFTKKMDEMGMGRHHTTKKPSDPTFSKEWSGKSFAPHSSKTCSKCGGHTHLESDSLYCPRCDDYVKANEAQGNKLDALVAAIKKDIIADPRLAKCKSFSQLHDYCDANMLGNLEDLFPDDNLSMDGEAMKTAIKAQDIVDQWLKSGKNERKVTEAIPSYPPAKRVATQEEAREVALYAREMAAVMAKKNPPVDYGSCVLGNGIEIEFMRDGSRKPSYSLIVGNHDIGCQSEQEKFLKSLQKNLEQNYPQFNFRYAWGNMD